MIAKISASSSFYSAAQYNQQKVEIGQASILSYQGLLNTQPKMIAYTLDHLNNSRTKKPVFHASLSFSSDDGPKLTDKAMLAITKDYLQRMGYDKQPYVIYRHHDTKHPHVHILTTRVDTMKGKRLPSYKEGNLSKSITEELEQKYQLTIATKQKATLQQQILKDINRALQTHKPETVAALNAGLKENGSLIRTKAVKTGGIYYKIDEGGKRRTQSYKSSFPAFRKTPIYYGNLRQQFQQHTKERLSLGDKIVNSLPKAEKITLTSFRQSLETKGVELKIQREGLSIKGLSYQYNGHSYQAARIDESLSFSNIQQQVRFPSQEDLKFKEQLLEYLNTRRKIAPVLRIGDRYQTGNTTIDNKLNTIGALPAAEIAIAYNARVKALGTPQENNAKVTAQYEQKIDTLLEGVEKEGLVEQRQLKLRIG